MLSQLGLWKIGGQKEAGFGYKTVDLFLHTEIQNSIFLQQPLIKVVLYLIAKVWCACEETVSWQLNDSRHTCMNDIYIIGRKTGIHCTFISSNDLSESSMLPQSAINL